MFRRVALVRTDVPEDRSAPIIRIYLRGVRRLLVTANVPSSPILVILMMEALRSSETSVLTGATRRNIPEDGMFINFRRFSPPMVIGVLRFRRVTPESLATAEVNEVISS
jgi:hypothetical protein